MDGGINFKKRYLKAFFLRLVGLNKHIYILHTERTEVDLPTIKVKT